MATDTLIVQIIQFICTKQCAADPSLFEAVRNIVQSWQDRGLKAQYWGTAVEKPVNTIYWILLWQSRAHSDAFVADASYPEFVERRLSLAATPVRDVRVSLTGVEPFITAPCTQVLLYKTPDTGIEEVHKRARDVVNAVRSLQPPGFHGSTYGVTTDDPTLGVYIAGWRDVEDHMCLGMEEGHENYRETTEDIMSRLTDLIFMHVALKKHGA